MEVLISIADGPLPTSYKDGDIVQAFSLKQTHFCHAEMICVPRKLRIDTTSGLRRPDPILIKYLEKTNVFKFERLNSNDVLKTNLVTGHQKIVNTNLDDDGERIQVYQFLKRRLKSPRHLIFGSSGQEYWYGKSRPFHDIDTDAIWYDVETHSDNLKQNHNNWPLTSIEKSFLLPMNCCSHVCHDDDHHHDDVACLCSTCDCDLSECSSDFVGERLQPVDIVYNEGTEDEYNVITHKRKFQVPYWDFSSSLSFDVDDVRNKLKQLDLRKPLDSRPCANVLTVDKVVAGIIDG